MTGGDAPNGQFEIVLDGLETKNAANSALTGNWLCSTKVTPEVESKNYVINERTAKTSSNSAPRMPTRTVGSARWCGTPISTRRVGTTDPPVTMPGTLV